MARRLAMLMLFVFAGLAWSNPASAAEVLVEFKAGTTGEQIAGFLRDQQQKGIVPKVVTTNEEIAFVFRLKTGKAIPDALKALRASSLVKKVEPQVIGLPEATYPVSVTFAKGVELSHINALVDELAGAGYLSGGKEVATLGRAPFRARLTDPNMIAEPAPARPPLAALDAEIGVLMPTFAPEVSLFEINRWVFIEHAGLFFSPLEIAGEGRRLRAVMTLEEGRTFQDAAREFEKHPIVERAELKAAYRQDKEVGASIRKAGARVAGIQGAAGAGGGLFDAAR